ncbi:glycosyltransferase involved in cell wall biosynthesis [Catenulispora sp. GAS73]|uniref:glycosyltransferase n=1 Tax=Catenulispora sp. GAS73 TaxID=3156269 RepID=UPI003512F3F9
MAGTVSNIGITLAIVSTYPPRRCGIATYSRDLAVALNDAAPDVRVEVCALDRDGLAYPATVRTVIGQDERTDYRRAAQQVAASGVGAVVIQHEFGIFGGPDGAWITDFAAELHRLGVPYLVTLHTVLSEPSSSQADTLYRLCRDAAAVTVFTGTASRLAVDTGIAPADRIVHVPHGAPPPGSGGEIRPEVAATLDRLAGRRLLSTFGLLSPGKGLETAIAALGRIAEQHPDVTYLIAGSTHPEIARQEGEHYRDKLVLAVKGAKLEDRVVFLDLFLSDAEISAVLARTEIFCTPYRSREQISSGALTFAVAAGCPVVSTSYFYAEDMLAGGAGITVPPEDPEAYAEALHTLLSDPDRMERAREAARTQGAGLHWTAVARRFAGIARATAARRARPVPDAVATDAAGMARVDVPKLKLTHLNRITDSGGIVQFSDRAKPDLGSGYCVDDVSRLAIVAAGLCDVPVRELKGADPHDWLDTSLGFLEAGYDASALGSRNMRDATGVWLDEPHTGDHVGRLLWSLGAVAAGGSVPDKYRERAAALLEQASPALRAMATVRSTAYALLGLVRVPEPTPELALGVARLEAAFRATATDDWPWFENELTYDNARLAQALLAGGERAGDGAVVGDALRALDWYLGQVGLGESSPSGQAGPSGPGEEPEGHLTLIGNLWRRKGAVPARYEGDEQPIDAAAVVEACVEAWRVTGREFYADRARRAFGWFLGANRLGLPLYDASSGGGRDGLRETDANPNQGAESTLAYYQALLALRSADLV